MSSEKTLPSIASLSGPTTLPPIVENKQTSLYLPSIFTDLDSLTSKGKQPLAPTYPAPFMHNVYRRDSSASASDSDGEPSAVFSRNSFSDNSTSPHYHTMDSKTTDSASNISPSNPIHIHTVNSTLLLSQITPSNRRGVPRSGLRHSCKYPDCGWSFKRFEHLKRHMMTHSGEKPFVCDFPGCGKSFGRSDNFAAHTRIHTHQPLPVENVTVNPSAQEKKRPNSAEASLAINVEKKQRLSKSPSPAAAVRGTSNSCSIKSLLNEDISSNNNVAKDPTDDERNAAAMCLAFLPFAAQREPVGLPLPTNHNIPLSPTSSTTLTSPSSPVGSPSDCTGPFTLLERTAPVQQRRSLPMDFYPSRNQTTTSTLHMENYITFQQPARTSLPTGGHSQRLKAEASDAFDPSKPHVCTHPSGCNRRFKRREHLRRHSRTHTDEKPFVCPTCMKSFSRSDNLNQHARTHGVRTGSMTSNTNNTTTVTTSTNPTPTAFPSTLLRRSVSMTYFPSEGAAQPGGTTFEGNRTS